MAIKGVLFDIDGVLVTSWEPIARAADAVRTVVEAGYASGFLTSTTSLTQADIAMRLWQCGIPVEPEEIVTAAKLTAEFVKRHHEGARCWLLNSGEVQADMSDIEFAEESPDLIILGGAGPVFTHEALSRVAELMVEGVPVIAMHRALSWTTSAGLKIDVGAYLPGLEAVGHRDITVIGKPSERAFSTAAAMMGVGPREVVMVGDDVNADVLAGQAAGMTGVLVRTGKFRPETMEGLDEEPDHIIDSVADLPELLSSLTGR
ncbi:HAD-IIA family hydrolase [Hoyosella subflava]|uniref:Possible hydrolase n=1 Tax=Hoyosella subflava (strain DSM 45089 / JCM 17490 / NBRC 109087 / DQS3-9A1) TaxID=443218 RepID=F6EJH7_HOYSD|nr:HAD-IIA family hydrolase [Hoyosella subflava]AEF39026.1 Possible hydrolase [Hoyosella subflava DQS3-9A1]